MVLDNLKRIKFTPMDNSCINCKSLDSTKRKLLMLCNSCESLMQITKERNSILVQSICNNYQQHDYLINQDNKIAKIPSHRNTWDTISREYGFDRVAKSNGSSMKLLRYTIREFRKNSIVKFFVYNRFVDISWNPLDVIDTIPLTNPIYD